MNKMYSQEVGSASGILMPILYRTNNNNIKAFFQASWDRLDMKPNRKENQNKKKERKIK
jgi:hypothetical protein